MSNKNLELNNIFICDQVILDKNGKISLIGMFETINSIKFPATLARFSIVVKVSGIPGVTFKEKVELINEKDGKSITSNVEKELEIDKVGFANIIIDFNNVIFPNEGKYWVKVSIDGKVISDSLKYYVLVAKI